MIELDDLKHLPRNPECNVQGYDVFEVAEINLVGEVAKKLYYVVGIKTDRDRHRLSDRRRLMVGDMRNFKPGRVVSPLFFDLEKIETYDPLKKP